VPRRRRAWIRTLSVAEALNQLRLPLGPMQALIPRVSSQPKAECAGLCCESGAGSFRATLRVLGCWDRAEVPVSSAERLSDKVWDLARGVAELPRRRHASCSSVCSLNPTR